MTQTTIKCSKCGARLTVYYPTSFSHTLTDEALAIDRAIKEHQCHKS